MLTAPLSLMAKLPVKSRNGMPFLSAGAGALLRNSICPLKPNCGLSKSGNTLAKKCKSALGRLSQNAWGLMPSPLKRICPTFLPKLSANGRTAVSARKDTPLPAKSVFNNTSCKLPSKSKPLCTAIPSKSPCERILPRKANGRCAANASVPLLSDHGVCSEAISKRCKLYS